MPVLLIITLGAVDMGRAFYAVIAVSNAAREASYYATSHAGDGASGTGECANPVAASLRTVVLNELQSLPTESSNPTVTCSSTNDGQSYSFTASPTCSTTGVSPTCGGGTCVGNTCTRNFRYVTVTVAYTFNTIGPYGPILPNYEIQRTVRMRVRT